MALLIRKLSEDNELEHRLCVTGQHKEMLMQVLDFFEIKPDYNLDIMKVNQDLFDVTTGILGGLRSVLDDFKPGLVLVHGDTTTCMAATIAAYYKGIRVGHIESGLRTWNLQSPFPEEANRQIADRLATFHFAPTETNAVNLIKEGFDRSSIYVTGNTVIDSLIYAKDKVNSFVYSDSADELNAIVRSGRKIVLVTGHRRENFGSGFLNICHALHDIAKAFDDIEIIYPVHLNPNVQKPVYDILSNVPNVHLVKPLDYPDFVYAMKASWIIITDSGGVQEEAPSLGKPVLVMRDTTERPEALAAGSVKLVGALRESIFAGVKQLYCSTDEYERMSKSSNPYGGGKATDTIVEVIKNQLPLFGTT